MSRIITLLSLLLPLSAAAAPVDIKVDWNSTVRTASREAYSLNAFHSFNPAIPANPAYRENIAYINPGMIRYHASGIVSDSRTGAKGWLDHGTRKWDMEKIRTATAAWPRHAAIQLTIPSWPSWMYEGKEKLLSEACYNDYAALCADLVRILNVELKLGVQRWEPMNERELAYVRALERAGKKTQYDKLIEIYNRCAVAMKKADPSIKVGGPAISSSGWHPLILQFLRGARDNIDFFSYHQYSTDDPARTDESIFDSATNFGRSAAQVIEMVKAEIPGRKVDVVLNEFNISWTAQAKDVRMTNHKGAVFDALVMAAVITNGVAGTFAWNDVDNTYGKMSRSYELRPSAHVYHQLNDHFVGNIVTTSTSDDKAVVPFAAVEKDTSHRSLMLINRSQEPQTARLVISGRDWAAITELRRVEISEAGLAETSIRRDQIKANTLSLPAYSVTFLVEADRP